MISDDSFTKERILSLRRTKGYEKADPQIVEKVLYALYLVELLSINNLNFIFKGGTCLVLLFPEIQRFSIDVDIITEASQENLEIVLKKITSDKKLIRYEYDKKRSFSDNIPKAHYKLFLFLILIKKKNIYCLILFLMTIHIHRFVRFQ